MNVAKNTVVRTLSSAQVRDRPNSQGDRGSKDQWLIVALSIIYVESFAFDGLLRYSFFLLGVPSAIYFRELIPFVIILWILYRWAHEDIRFVNTLLMIYALLLHSTIGILNTGNLLQVAFGAKIMLAFVLGTVLGTLRPKNLALIKNLATITLIFSIGGVYINYFGAFPWEGTVFESSLGTVDAVREWSMSGIKRLSGFSRSSYDAAAAICGSLLYVTAYEKRRGILLISWIASIVAVVLTTTKGATLALSACFILLLLSQFCRLWSVWRWAMITSVALMILLPSIVWVSGESYVAEAYVPDILISFAQRMTFMWPQSILLIDNFSQYFFGRGIGGIGVAQRFSFDRYFSAADNMFVYAYITFGLLSLVYLIKITYSTVTYNGTRSNMILTICIPTFVFLYGTIVNIIEQPILMFSLGFAYALSYLPHSEN